MRCKIILLQVLSVSLVFAQDIEDQVSVFLSDTVSKNPSLKSTIYNQMRPKAEIHPELSYHYLRYLKTYYKIQSNQDIRAVHDFLNQAVQHYKLQRSAWAENQLQEARENLNRPLYGLISPLFKKYILKSAEKKKPAATSPGLKNEMDYMVCLYYQSDSIIIYSPQHNYTIKRVEMEARIIDGFNKYYGQTLSAKYHLDSDEITRLFHSWYLFCNDSSNELKPKATFKPYEFISRFYRRQFIRQKFHISFRHSIYNTTFSYSLIPEPGRIKESKKMNQRQMSLGLNYRYFIRDDYSMFCFLNFGFYMSIHSPLDPISEKTPSPYVLKYTQNDHLIIENLTYKYYTLQGKRDHSLSALISTPLAFIFSKGSLNLGVFFGYNQITYYHHCQYRYRKTENWMVGDSHIVRIWEDYTREDSVEKVERNYFIFPTLDILFPLWLNLIFEVNLSYKYGAVSISYKIQ